MGPGTLELRLQFLAKVFLEQDTILCIMIGGQYDPIANSWAQKADVPGPNRQSAVTFALNNIAYVGLGSGVASGGGDYSDFYSYNPATNIWTTLPNFPGAARYGCDRALFRCGKGYVGMGRNSSGAIFNDFYSFNPAIQYLEYRQAHSPA